MRPEMQDESQHKNRTAAEAQSREADLRWMSRAQELAGRGVCLASPNPAVGCVLVANNASVGEGWHEYDSRDHAEIVALRAAGPSARGATAYVTLEPCSHTGRTGPCALALREAGVRRVVVATVDPNPLVAGKGIAMLREAGIAVDCGVGEREARQWNESFARWIQTRLPFVTQKVAMTLDGRIAPRRSANSEQRQPFWITSENSRREVQRMRHASDALLTSIGTILADDPQLTDRSGLPRRRRLLRVVLDSQLRLPLTSRLVQSADEDLLVCTVSRDASRCTALSDRGVEVQRFEGDEAGRLPLDAVLAMLGEREILSVMAECGAELNTALLVGGHVDRCVCFVAPKILGADAVPAWNGVTFQDSGALALTNAEWSACGPDIRCSALLRDPWPSSHGCPDECPGR